MFADNVNNPKVLPLRNQACFLFVMVKHVFMLMLTLTQSVEGHVVYCLSGKCVHSVVWVSWTYSVVSHAAWWKEKCNVAFHFIWFFSFDLNLLFGTERMLMVWRDYSNQWMSPHFIKIKSLVWSWFCQTVVLGVSVCEKSMNEWMQHLYTKDQ